MTISITDPFHKRLLALLGSLVILCLLFAGLTMLQGPRIRSAQVDLKKVTTMPNQRLLLKANQPLGMVEAAQVTISPKTDVHITANGSTVLVQFKDRLQYGTKYTTHITTDDGHKLSHAFTTAKPSFYYLKPDPSGNDEIRLHEPGASDDVIVFQATEIIDYIVLDQALIVSVRNADFTNTLYDVSIATREQSIVQLPKQGTVAHLYAAPNRQTYGFSFTSKNQDKAYNNTLFITDTAANTTSTIKGLDGKPVQVLDWRFAPDNNTLLIQLFDTSVILTGLTAADNITPLGQYADIGGFTADGSKALLEGITEGPVAVELASNTTQALPSAPLGQRSFVTDLVAYSNIGGYLALGQAYTGNTYIEYVMKNTQGKQTEFYRTKAKEGIFSVLPSPNDQYVAIGITTSPEGVIQYKTHLLDVQRRTITTVDGNNLRW